MQQRLGVGNTKEDNAAAAPGRVNGLGGGAGGTDAFNDHIGAVSPQNLGKPLVQVFVQRINSTVGAQFQRQLPAHFHRLTEHCLCRARGLCKLKHHLSDGAAAHNQYVFTGADTCPVDAVQAAGQRLGQRGQLRVDAFRDGNALFIGHQTVVGKPAVHGNANGLHMQTGLLLTLTAGRTGSAIDVGVHGHKLAGLQTTDTRANLLHNAGKFVTQNHRRRDIGGAFAALIDVDVCSAHATGGNAQQNLPRARRAKMQRTDFYCLISKKISANHWNFLLILKRNPGDSAGISQSWAASETQRKTLRSCKESREPEPDPPAYTQCPARLRSE